MTWRYLTLAALILFLLSCSEDFVPDNPLDPENPTYIPPLVTITDGPQDGSTVSSSSVDFEWDGNEPAMTFRYRLDDESWSAWVSSKSTTFNYLDEGDYTVSVQGQYTTSDTSEVVSSSFTVDAVSGSALRFYRLYTEAGLGDQIILDIYAEEVVSLAGAEIVVEFDYESVSYLSVSPGDFFLLNGGETILFDTLTVEAGTGTLRLDVAVLGGDPEYVSGTGVMASLVFQASGTGETEISFNAGATTLRKANNDVIEIEDLVGGLVLIQ